MKRLILTFLLLSVFLAARSQLYFPPNTPGIWDTLSPTTLGWCQHKIDSLYQFLDSSDTKAFILLKDGKIVLEQYFNGHTAGDFWYWASAGKTLTATLVGIAQQEGLLHISDTSRHYLGQGWTNCSPGQEEKITIWHQLTMTSGLDDAAPDPYCTLDTCLNYLAEAGTRWAYHNAPYTLLDSVLETATGLSLNQYTNLKVKAVTGMDGLFFPQGYNNLFISTPRSMARFGLLILNRGTWDGIPILFDSVYFNAMTISSQNLNEAYGYLWWLNGTNSFMLPQSQIVFPGSLFPNAPADMISALGKDGQMLNVVPSQNLVWLRMGEAPSTTFAPFLLNNEIWEFVNDLACNPVETYQYPATHTNWVLYPNPVRDVAHLQRSGETSISTEYALYNGMGKLTRKGVISGADFRLDMSNMPEGCYYLILSSGEGRQGIHFIKQ
jgi:CubicO group peptidase (beta-lactamase class C family)